MNVTRSPSKILIFIKISAVIIFNAVAFHGTREPSLLRTIKLAPPPYLDYPIITVTCNYYTIKMIYIKILTL